MASDPQWTHYRKLWREAKNDSSRRLNRNLMRSCAKAYARIRGWAIGFTPNVYKR